jgi:Na+/melibiose symporter-like transporter
MRDKKHYDSIKAYRIIFFIYAVVGIIKLCLALTLSKACELEPKPRPKPSDVASSSGDSNVPATETAPLLGNGNAPGKDGEQPKKPRWRLLPDISKESQVTLVQLCVLFAFDNFASGLAPLSWVTYFFKRKFGISEGQLGTIFSITGTISALSIFVASSIAKRIGNVKVGSTLLA